MSIENLKSGLPEFAKDLKLNLGSLARSTELNQQQLWGTFLATAAEDLPGWQALADNCQRGCHDANP